MTDTSLLHAIDFGTSNSAIVICRPDGRLTPIADPASTAGSRSIRTSVCVLRNGKVEVGQAAENAKNLRPSAYRSEFKRDFGNPTPTTTEGRPMTADEMTVEVLRFLREQAQNVVPGDPDRVLITIPVSWEAGKKKLMRSVARLAGYTGAEIELIPEPVAATAYAFGAPYAPADQLTALVYDLGGGTFDCAVAHGAEGWYEVIGDPGGLEDVGGAAFDRSLLGLVGEHFGESAAAFFAGPTRDIDILRGRLNLKDQCEKLKWQLSVTDRAEEMLTALTPSRFFGLARTDFEALIRPLLAETVSECDRLLDRLDMGWADVDRVVLAGGSSRIPLVQEMLAGHCRRTVLRVRQPDMAVVLGAALIGRNELLAGPLRSLIVNGRKKQVRTPDLRFDEIVKLAFENPPAGSYVTYTVTYSRAAADKPSGSLLEGRSVRIQNGMVFNVTATDKS